MKKAMRPGKLGMALVALMALAGCEDKATDYLAPISPAADQVAAIRLAVGTQTMTVYKDGKTTLGPLTFIRPNAVLTATLLDAQGNPIPNVDPTQVVVNLGVETSTTLTGFTFTRLNAFSGTLAGTTAGNANFAVSLFDAVSRRAAFGPYYVSVVVR